MKISMTAFSDELLKIAEEGSAPDITRERLKRALTTGLAAAGGYGIGTGLGSLLGDKVLPVALNKHMPNPTASQLRKGMLVAAGIGGLGSYAQQVMHKKVMDAAASADQKPVNYLDSHHKLNPGAAGAP